MIAATALWVAALAGGDSPAVVSAYSGTWRTRIDYRDTPHSHAHRETSTLRNDCWRSAPLQICHQFVDGKSAALLLYRCGGGACRVLPVADALTSANAGELVADGRVWTYPWQETHEGRPVYFRVINTFGDADTIEFRSEYSDDREHWTVMATGHERRIR